MSDRLSGHTLANEGAPFLRNEMGEWQRQWKRYGGVSGEGRGLCSCGAASEILPSAYQRKKWHREHKQVAAKVERSLDALERGEVTPKSITDPRETP